MGKPNRVPYLKGGFRVEGLPDGIQFKKPYHYGANQRKKIMQAADDIIFVLDPSRINLDKIREPIAPKANDVEPVRSLLTKIVGAEVAKRVLTSSTTNQKIKEDEVEVLNLVLNEEERILLYSLCPDLYFTHDAWLAVGHNMEHCEDEKGLILPVYTEATEKFWLFYAVAKPLHVLQAGPQTALRGHWMDLQPEGHYDMVYADQILGENIVNTLHGPLYFIPNVNISKDHPYNLPATVRKAILVALGHKD